MVEVDEAGIRPGLARITAIPAIYRPSLASAASTTRMWQTLLAAQPAASKIAAISPRRTMDSRAIIRAAAVAAAVITMTVATPAAAERQSGSSQLSSKLTFPEIKHVQSGKCLAASVSLGVKLRDCNGTDYQRWYTESTMNGVTIVHLQSRKCLDGSVEKGIRLVDCRGNLYQRWYTYDSGTVPNLQNGKCLAASVSLGVKLRDCNGTNYQKWS
ncbi:RICIN domain-containing protein [Nonomuraea sp. NPDC050022]|uniref:RICIN domain-containing protein n=1 Tax=unclassified Nonomuraea TaxID=2593643 RepID=UPI003403CE6F